MIRLDERHKTEADYRQRMTTEDWKEVLLNQEETTIFNGESRTLSVRDLGYGVIEVYKQEYNIIGA